MMATTDEYINNKGIIIIESNKTKTISRRGTKSNKYNNGFIRDIQVKIVVVE